MPESLDEFLRSTATEGEAWGLGWFALILVATQLLPISRAAVCAAGGLFFGLAAMPIAVAAPALGAVLVFVASQNVLRPVALRLLRGNRQRQCLVRAVELEGWRLVLLVRLGSPLGAINNYLLGLTGIGLVPYTWATLLGVAPQSIIFVCVGMMGHAALGDGAPSSLQLGLSALSIGFLLFGAWYLARRVRARLAAIVDADAVRAETEPT